MSFFYPLLLFVAAAAPLTLDQVRADRDPEHRAKAAVDYAVLAERAVEVAAAEVAAAEAANDNGDVARLNTEVNNMVAAMELARDSFAAAGKTPSRQPGTFKGPELKSHEILHRLADLQNRMDMDQKSILDGPIMKIQEIHDAWFYGIMGKKK